LEFLKQNEKKNLQNKPFGWSKVQYWNCSLFYSGVKDLENNVKSEAGEDEL